MIISSTVLNGIILTIIGILVSAPFIIWSYLLYRRRQRYLDISDSGKSEPTRPNRGLIDMLYGAHAHTCSQCGRGFRVNMFDKLAECPKCGNVENR